MGLEKPNARTDQVQAELNARLDRLSRKLDLVIFLLVLIAMLWHPVVAELIRRLVRKLLGLG